MTFTPDRDDTDVGGGQGAMKVGYKSKIFTVRLPCEITLPHPDLVALVTVISLRPWIGHTLRMERPVSPEFASMAWKLLRIKVLPVDPATQQRKAGSTPVVSFSGGVDSIAASEVFPKTIPYVYYQRSVHSELPDEAPHVQTEGINDVVRKVKDADRNVYMVECDMEHICSPYPTLPNWFSIATGSVLLADHLDAGMLVMGGTFETYFMDMGRKWAGGQGKGIDPLAEIVGLPICRPMLGVTEVGTMKIAAKSEFGDIARSCVLGTREKPCGKCSKCVRKDMISSLIKGYTTQSLYELTEEAPGIKAYVGDGPYYMQAQIEYCLPRIESLPPVLEELYDRLGKPNASETDWMDSYYHPATEVGIPAGWRSYVEYEILRRLPRMTVAHINKVKSYSR